MNDVSKTSKNKKLIIVLSIAAGVLLLGSVYTAVAYSQHLWPFASTVVTQPLQSSVSASRPSMVVKDITTNARTDTLHIASPVDTVEQGTCTLKLIGPKKTYEFSNSTIGVKSASGCLDWNVGLASLPPGAYEVEVSFKGKTQSSVAKSQFTIAKQD